MAVHKISAKDSGKSAPAEKAAKVEKTVVKAVKKEKVVRERNVPAVLRPFAALGGYFVGAWRELREVRWPTRKATWSLTIAVLGFSAFFTILILLLDAGYKSLFEIILK